MSRAVFDPNQYCPICGAKWGPAEPDGAGHRCKANVLAAIDGADRRPAGEGGLMGGIGVRDRVRAG